MPRGLCTAHVEAMLETVAVVGRPDLGGMGLVDFARIDRSEKCGHGARSSLCSGGGFG
jgi:hypothetical protein